MLRARPTLLAVLVPVALAGCTVFDHPLPACKGNSHCNTDPSQPAWCVDANTETAACVPLMSEDCLTITGDPTDDHAILIASLLSTTGAQGATNLARQQSAILAVEEINQANASGGILQSQTPGDTRKLVMLSCDEAANLPRAATHLISELKVPAIVGPNLSQDTLDITTGDATRGLPSSAQAGTAILSPAAVASAIASVPDNGLTFQMVPPDIFRIPLMKQQINTLEAQMKMPVAMGGHGVSIVHIGIVYRNDAFGMGTSDALTSLTINGMSLAANINLGYARVDNYDPSISSVDTMLVQAYVSFAPDIIVAVGTGEIVPYFMSPLEAMWDSTGHPNRPFYVATDSTKVPGLLTAVANSNYGAGTLAAPYFRQRVRGTGVLATPESLPVFQEFQVLYGQRWKDSMGNPQPTTISNMGQSYDTVYSIALALVGQKVVTGANVAAGLTGLGSLTQTCSTDASGYVAPCYADSDYTRSLYGTMSALLAKTAITEIGTFARFTWDMNGSKNSGLIEVWCINGTNPATPIFSSSGLTYDVATMGPTAGIYTQCP